MVEFLATLAFMGVSLTAIAGVIVLNLSNPNKYPDYCHSKRGGHFMIEYLTPALLFFVLAFAVETRMKLAKLCGQFMERGKKD